MMKVGYPCANRTLKLSSNNTTRLASLSPEKLIEKISLNIKQLKQMLEWNVQRNLLFFRIGSGFIPFASHEKLREESFNFSWQEHFNKELVEIGNYVKDNNIRISLHPDHFVLINSTSEDIFKKSYYELKYHADLLNAMGLDTTHKFQIHLGGKYGDKQKSMQRFVDRYKNDLTDDIRDRLVLENDDHVFSFEDAMWINEQCGIPILLDTLHHECLHDNEQTTREVFLRAAKTWNKEKDGCPMIDYSIQQPGAKVGKHISSIQLKHFKQVICKDIMEAKDEEGNYIDFDVMLEIKDKEKSAVKCIDTFMKSVRIVREGSQEEDDVFEDEPVPEDNDDEEEDGEEKKKKPRKKKAASTKASTKKQTRKKTKKEEDDEEYTPEKKRKSTRNTSTRKKKKVEEEDDEE
ncbi:hypothetical protein ABK040_010106 [Willaertia magna]